MFNPGSDAQKYAGNTARTTPDQVSTQRPVIENRDFFFFSENYGDSQNSGKFFLFRPLLQWEKNLEKFMRVERASKHKKINFAQCKIKNF